MRTFEIAILCLLVIAVAAMVDFLPRSLGSKWFRMGLCGLVGLAVATHLVWEGAHWQMAPAYLAALLTAGLLLAPLRRGVRIAGGAVVLLCAGLSGALSYVLPMFELPVPTGTYAIGTRIVSMIDPSRREDALHGELHPREVVVQIWYPASHSGLRPTWALGGLRASYAPYRRRSETSLASSYQSVDWTHALLNAPVADGRFPVIFYNPGWNGRRTQNTPLTEELASHGYVVVAIDHPYNSGPVALADGRVIKPVPAPELFDDVTSASAIYALIDKELDKETTDTQFVLDKVKSMNADSASPFYRRLDLARMGAFGYSLGGAVAAELAYRDAEIHAVLDLDTPLYGEAGRHGISQPFMLLSEDMVHSTPEELARMSFGQRRDAGMDEGDYARQLPMLMHAGSYQVSVHGTLHTSFQDVLLTSPLARFSGGGAVRGKRMTAILRQYALAFFDQSLRGISSPLLAPGSRPFAEATMVFPAPVDQLAR